MQSPGLSSPEDLPQSIAELVDYYAKTVVHTQAEGSVYLLGWSFGGMVAHALAAELRRRGREVALLALLDASPAEPARWAAAGITAEVPEETAYRQLLEALGVPIPGETVSGLTREQFLVLARDSNGVLASLTDDEMMRIIEVMRLNRRMVSAFSQEAIDVPTVLFVATEGIADGVSRELWRPYVGDDIEVYDVSSTHLGMTSPASLSCIGPLLERCLRERVRQAWEGRDGESVR
jgi:thioesterase domain-containing protein